MCGIVGYYFSSERLALIHNGIPGNYAVLKKFQARRIHLKKEDPVVGKMPVLVSNFPKQWNDLPR